MIRTGITCLAVSLIAAGCAAPISLDEDPSTEASVMTPADPASNGMGTAEVLPIDPPAAPPAPSGPARERLRGALGAQGLLLCGQNQPLPMRVSPEARAALESYLASHASFNIDGWGRNTGTEIEIESVERMYVEGPKCNEPLDRFVWVAHGQEPFWAFAITNAGMQFRSAGQPARAFPYSEAQTDGNQVVYSGPDFRLSLVKQDCHASVSDSRYAWTASLDIAGQQWQGCAWQGMQVEPPQAVAPVPAVPANR